jgi:putative NADPH-quinone reductase
MSRHILIIQGHPDASKSHYGHALAEAYAKGATQAGRKVKTITVAELDFPLIHRYEEFYDEAPPPAIVQCQDDIRWADHLVFIYPLWMASMPALVKGFIEQVFRFGFAMEHDEKGKIWTRLLKGKSARIIITMGMPAFFYRCFLRAYSLKTLERNILKFFGIKPIRHSLIGNVEGSAKHRERWLKKIEELGKAGI